MLAKKKKAYDDEDDELETSEDDDASDLSLDLGSDLDSEFESDADVESESEGESESDPELMSAASAAFPDFDWTPDRLSALKDLIHLCSNKDYDDEPKDEGDGGLALVFGEPKTKK